MKTASATNYSPAFFEASARNEYGGRGECLRALRAPVPDAPGACFHPRRTSSIQAAAAWFVNRSPPARTRESQAQRQADSSGRWMTAPSTLSVPVTSGKPISGLSIGR